MNEKRITDYALNELQGDEREKFESDLASDQDLQRALESASRVADGLAVVMSEPGEGLVPQAREKLLRAIARNQEALRQRRKIVRFAVPVSLAAAASIAVLFLVAGGKTTQGPAVAAADGALNGDRSGGFTAKINSERTSFTFRGDGQLSSRQDEEVENGAADSFQFRGVHIASSPARTISMSESARVAQELREDAGLSLTSPAVRMKPLIWDDDLTRLGSIGE
jgi:hypothetical protein